MKKAIKDFLLGIGLLLLTPFALIGGAFVLAYIMLFEMSNVSEIVESYERKEYD